MARFHKDSRVSDVISLRAEWLAACVPAFRRVDCLVWFYLFVLFVFSINIIIF